MVQTELIPVKSSFGIGQIHLTFSVIWLLVGSDGTMPHLLAVGSVLRNKLQHTFSAVYGRDQPVHIPDVHIRSAGENAPVPGEDPKKNIVYILYGKRNDGSSSRI